MPVRFTQAERDLIENAATADEQSVSAWVRDRAVEAAKRRAQRRRTAD
ncbi:type II toxin -antitoxin system TacA 1-like antitoxin [Mycobacterium sp. ML2]